MACCGPSSSEKCGPATAAVPPTKSATSSTTRGLGGDRADPLNDIAVLLVVMDRLLGRRVSAHARQAERSLVNELIDVRRVARHTRTPSPATTPIGRSTPFRGCLTAVSASQAEEVEKMSMELAARPLSRQVRSQQRRSAGTVVDASDRQPQAVEHGNTAPRTSPRPLPAGRFAADLWQVHLGRGVGQLSKSSRVLPPHLPDGEPKQMLTGAILPPVGQR